MAKGVVLNIDVTCGPDNCTGMSLLAVLNFVNRIVTPLKRPFIFMGWLILISIVTLETR